MFNLDFISLINQDLKLKIISSIGEIIFEEKINNLQGLYRTSFVLTNYNKSIYLLEIQTESGMLLKKLILQ